MPKSPAEKALEDARRAERDAAAALKKAERDAERAERDPTKQPPPYPKTPPAPRVPSKPVIGTVGKGSMLWIAVAGVGVLIVLGLLSFYGVI